MKTTDVFQFQALGWACLLGGALAASTSFGGTANWGGGTGVVCRDQNNRVVSARLLDLYEGSEIDGLKIPDVDVDPHLQARAALSRLAFGFADDAEVSPMAFIDHLKDALAETTPGKFIESPIDKGGERAPILPTGCQFEGIGYREKPNHRLQLTVVPDVLNAMTKTQQAAFLVHEAIYSYYVDLYKDRVDRERGTVEIRKITARLFASGTGLRELTSASNFLFDGKAHLDERQANARATLVGRVHPLDMHFDTLKPASARKFYCEGEGARVESVAVAVPGAKQTWNLELKETNACLSRVVILDVNALLQVNGRDVLEVANLGTLELVFLKDHPRYREYSWRARYPFAANFAGR